MQYIWDLCIVMYNVKGLINHTIYGRTKHPINIQIYLQQFKFLKDIERYFRAFKHKFVKSLYCKPI